MTPAGRLTRAFPDTLFARIALVLLVNLGLVWAVALVLFELEERLTPVSTPYLQDRIVASVEALDSVSTAQRNDVARAISAGGFVAWSIDPGEPRPMRATPDDSSAELVAPLTERFRRKLSEHAKPPEIWFYTDPDPAEQDKASTHTTRLAVGLSDGGLAVFRIRLTSPSLRWYPILGTAVAVCVIVSALSLLFARAFSRQLAAFAGASEAFGRSGDSPPLPESGPREIRLATRAFNLMQERLRRFVRDRTQMLAAMSHDLRTPLTRLRLRAEFLDQDEHRLKILSDIAEMEAMITETLAFARDDAARELRSRERLDKLLSAMCAAQREAGRDVRYEPGGPIVVELSVVAIRRAIGNLLENAIKYGKRARVLLERIPGHVVITIDDDGPGIPEDLQEHVFQPFQRLETSRNRDTGGVGLGLSVARTIIRGHGGDVSLANRPEGGLRVTLMLPA
jgi:signal transduction histidine kinase